MMPSRASQEVTQDIPHFVEAEGCNCRVWYPRQPAQCSVSCKFCRLALTCPLLGRCRRCHQSGHTARECTQAWRSQLITVPSVSVDQALETESRPSGIPDQHFSATASTASTVATVTPSAGHAATVVTGTVSPVTSVRPPVPSVPNVTSTVTPVSTTSATPATATVSPKAPRLLVTGMVFADRIFERTMQKDLQNVDHVTGKEWDIRAMGYLRQSIKGIIEPKEMYLTNGDLLKWTDSDPFSVCDVISNQLSIRNYLKEFVFVMVKGYCTHGIETVKQ